MSLETACGRRGLSHRDIEAEPQWQLPDNLKQVMSIYPAAILKSVLPIPNQETAIPL
jgi:hypothetical protein